MESSSQFPAGPEQLTPEWISNVLYKAGAIRDASVRSLVVSAANEGRGFVGRVFRCALQYDREEPGAPAAVIAKFPTADVGYRALLDEFAVYEREVRFYSEMRNECPIPTPVCYFAERDSESGEFVILLEDLAPAQPGNPIAGCSAREALAVVDTIARQHARWWGDEHLDRLDWLPTPDVVRMQEYISRNYDDAWQAFSRRSVLPPQVSRAGRLLSRHLPGVLQRLSSPPRTLVHGDFQLGNIFFAGDGTIRAVADWQVVARARGPMDLSHFLVRSLDPAARRRAERDLIRHYHAVLLQNGIENYSLQECWADYRLSVLSQLGLGVALEYALSRHKREEPEPATESALEALKVVGARGFAALSDLRPEELLPRERLWNRLLPSSWRGRSRAPVSG